ncbi:uncharacterized protein LOC127857328 [Dreissena polymorpha]|uniref:Mab-21-like HhH/H2TH-like domain-containing protein n=1 Tax=Dreissena polymorpha TaxID=45954 RepID=A0A9D3Z501_DREPO|nr:uncharacterized protein LOC127857328 [Dreissena polymorpha]KAH3710751.1 hypothetical protein DPMN_070245 [Dreissena polymorpha]
MAEGGFRFETPDDVHATCHRGLSSSHSQVQCENASLETCNVMNCLGYGPEIRQARRDSHREYDRLRTACGPGVATVITTGSKAEGLSNFFESDMDVLIVEEGVMCLEDVVNSDTLPRETTVFTLNTSLCYHGHSRLYLLERGGTIKYHVVHVALCNDENGNVLLSSASYFDFYNKMGLHQDEVRHERAGPSRPSSFGPLDNDLVFSLRCHCPGILLKWAQRSRYWPPPDVVHKVVKMGAFMTPVGFKGSEYQHVEWRICFNTGENELVSSLNNTLVYVYIILKMVVKDVLKPVKKEITSYTVKNIVFWLAENNSQARFDNSSLLYWLREGLEQLKTAILKIHLPYYMIPERNLMAACGLNEEQKQTWIQIINDMMNEGQKILSRLPKIRKAIISHPEPLLWYNKKRVEIELVNLMSRNRIEQCMDEKGVINESDPMHQALRRRVNEIVREVRQRMIEEGSRVDALMEIYTKMMT